MKISYLFVFILTISPAFGAGFLSAEKFPTTFNDLDFVSRMEILRAGYEPWESEYDDNGKCISNCVYPGISIEDDMAAGERQTAAANAQLEKYRAENGITSPELTPVATATTPPKVPVPIPIQTTPTIPDITVPTNICDMRNYKIPLGQMMPLGNPLLGNFRTSSPYGMRTHPITGKQQFHKGIDFAAPLGTQIFSPANGFVDSVWTDAICGNGLRIDHGNGFSTVYCHLNKTLVRRGDSVAAGCPIAHVGTTGRSTGPHLHYGIRLNGGLINPDNFISG